VRALQLGAGALQLLAGIRVGGFEHFQELLRVLDNLDT